MRISDWSSDVCSSDLAIEFGGIHDRNVAMPQTERRTRVVDQDIEAAVPVHGMGDDALDVVFDADVTRRRARHATRALQFGDQRFDTAPVLRHAISRSEEHTSELQSLMRISYAVFCLKKKKHELHGTLFRKYAQALFCHTTNYYFLQSYSIH